MPRLPRNTVGVKVPPSHLRVGQTVRVLGRGQRRRVVLVLSTVLVRPDGSAAVVGISPGPRTTRAGRPMARPVSGRDLGPEERPEVLEDPAQEDNR